MISGTPEILKAVKPEFITNAFANYGNSFGSNTGGPINTKVINLTKDTAYVHLFCAFWFLEVEATDMVNLDSIVGIDEIRDEHKDKECSLCRNKEGAKVKCSDKNCQDCFHPICGKIRRN